MCHSECDVTLCIAHLAPLLHPANFPVYHARPVDKSALKSARRGVSLHGTVMIFVRRCFWCWWCYRRCCCCYCCSRLRFGVRAVIVHALYLQATLCFCDECRYHSLCACVLVGRRAQRNHFVWFLLTLFSSPIHARMHARIIIIIIKTHHTDNGDLNAFVSTARLSKVHTSLPRSRWGSSSKSSRPWYLRLAASVHLCVLWLAELNEA